jgi:hypothetical protein
LALSRGRFSVARKTSANWPEPSFSWHSHVTAKSIFLAVDGSSLVMACDAGGALAAAATPAAPAARSCTLTRDGAPSREFEAVITCGGAREGGRESARVGLQRRRRGVCGFQRSA